MRPNAASPSEAVRAAAEATRMPIYTYRVIHEDGSEGEVFEYEHGMSETLEEHPETGEKVVRVFQAPHVPGAWGESANKERMSDKNLERLGFTKYQRTGKGHYERRAGKEGPDHLSVD